MFDDAIEAFYRDFLSSNDDRYRYGLTTTKIDSDGSWKWAKNRAGTAEQLREWLDDAIHHQYDAHLSVGLIPVDAIVNASGKYNQKDIKHTVARVFCLDLDVYHNPDKKRKKTDYVDAAEAEQGYKDAIESGLPVPDYKVESGSGGLHLWYIVQNYIHSASHRQLHNAFVKSAIECGLKLDASAAGAKQKIRAPGSRNNKPHIAAYTRGQKTGGTIRSLRVLQKQFGTDIQVRAAAGDEIEAQHREDNQFEEYDKYPSASVAKACPFMVYQLKTGSNELDRSEWLGVASVVRHLDNWPDVWREACHEHYGDVTDDDIDIALDPEQGLAGPIGCAAMGGGIGNHPVCKGCQINTMGRGKGYPINWIQHVHNGLQQGKEPPAPKKPPKKPKHFENFEVPDFVIIPSNDTYAVFKSKTSRGKTIPDSLVAQPAYRVTRIEHRQAGSLAFLDVSGQERVIEMQNVNHQNSLSKALGKVGVLVNNASANLFYFREMVAHLQIPNMVMGAAAGWGPDFQSFTTLDRCIRVGGYENETLLENPPLNGVCVGSEGTVSEWRSAMDVLNEHDAQVFVFSTMLGFASVLPYLVNRTHQPPAVVSFYHPDSGQGKSTAQILGNAVFMRELPGNIGFDDTDGSAYKSLGVMQHMLCSIDEMTTKVRDQNFSATRFVNTVQQGFERGRLTSGSTQMERAQWRCILTLSTNSPIAESLAIDEAQGGLARVQEFYFDHLPLPEYSAKLLLSALAKNHGTAGPEFVRQLMERKEFRFEVNARYEQWVASLSAATQTNTSHRFALSLFAHTLTALQYTNQFLITDFDAKKLFNWCVEQLEQRVQNARVQIQRTEVTPSDFYNYVRMDIHSAQGLKLYESESGLMRDSEYPVFYQNGQLFFTNVAFNKWCQRHSFKHGLLAKWTNEETVMEGVKRRTFKISGHSIAPQNYHRMDLASVMGADVVVELEELASARTT